jgi:isopropylmalate/homocitrate/citramalate synthase
MQADVMDYLFTWNAPVPPHVDRVRIDDDTLRDGLQGAYAPRIPLEHQQEFLRLTDAVGVDWSVIGFPSSSPEAMAQCRSLIEFAARERLRILPTLLARTHMADVAPLAQLAAGCAAPFMVELFVGTSPLRRHVEGWTLDQLLGRIRSACRPLVDTGVPVGLSLEDASRTPPGELAELIRAGVDGGVERLTLCDTVGDSLPEGAGRLTAHAKEILDKHHARCALAWHGHNDKGCAVGNSIAAVQAGADVVSGTFLGLGERTGNASLEQVIAYLHLAGSRRFRVDLLPRLAARLAELAGQAVPLTAPIVGMQAFATTAGVHAAALIKARGLGPGFEDYIYSGVPASAFGRRQAVLLGPMSGLANARNALELSGRAQDEALAQDLLAHAKKLARWMSPEEIGRYLERRP